MGEILLAFTIITLTFIVIYLKKAKSKEKDSSRKDEINNIILNTPMNNRQRKIRNMDDLNIFNGTNFENNNPINEINSPFVSSNPSYVKIKNINYNNINHISPINNYSFNKHNNYNDNSLDKTPNKDDFINPLLLDENLKNGYYQSADKKIKYINLDKDSYLDKPKLIRLKLLEKDNEINKNHFDKNPHNELEEFFLNDKIVNTEKKIRINNVIFNEIDYDSFKKVYILNTETKNLSINNLSKDISYYGVNNKFNNKKDSDNQNLY